MCGQQRQRNSPKLRKAVRKTPQEAALCTQSLSVKVIIDMFSIRNVGLNVHYEVQAG